MENASKALIIAGSILITILVISLGMMVFKNMSNSVEEQTDLTEQEIAAFNNQITPYIGENVSGSQVNALIQTVRSIDQKAVTEGTSRTVTINFSSSEGTGKITVSGSTVTTTGVSRVTSSGTYYTVAVTYDSGGLINSITVTPN